MAIRADGSLWGWGRGIEGLFGEGPESWNSPPNPNPVKIAEDVVVISNRRQMLKTDGTLWTLGAEPEKIMENIVAFSSEGRTMAIDIYGNLWDLCSVHVTRCVPEIVMEDVIAIASGSVHSGNYALAITSDGELWGWGCNIHGQLGDGTTVRDPNPNPVKIMDGVMLP